MKTDLLLTDGLDLQENAITLDWIEGESTAQHQQLLVKTEKGSWKENPTVGVGAWRFVESEDVAGLLREIRLQFSGDGMTIKQLAPINGKIEIEAPYL